MSYQAVQALLSKGISRPTLFQVIMPVVSDGANRQLDFLCKEASVPQVGVSTITANGHEALGVVREQPTFVEYAKPFSITVISDRDYTVYKELRRWFNLIAQNANPNVTALNGKSQRVNYFDTFARTITLKKLEQNGDQRYYQPFQIDFDKAYPVNIGEIGLSSEAYDGKVEFQVDFTYETYTFRDSNELSVFF